jgi:hypothetical protein
MPFVPVNVPPGVVKLATPLQSKGRYWDANLIRWRNGKLQPVGGWQRIVASALGSVCRTIFSWTTNVGNKYISFGCSNNLYVLEGSTVTDITPADYVPPVTGSTGGYGSWTYGSLYYGDDTDPIDPRPPSDFFVPSFAWTIDNWGEDILAVSSSDGRLLHWAYDQTLANVVGVSAISTMARVSNVITVTTTTPHYYMEGRPIVITGNSVAGFNASWTIASVPSENTFTIESTGTDASGTGGKVRDQTVPTNNRAVLVTPERNCLVVGAGGNPRRVAWSDTEDYTNWDFGDVTTTAGYLDLDSALSITMCCAVREGTLIWTEDEVWLARYIGLPYIYAIERIGFNCGLIAPRAFATAAGRCIWMGRESFWLYDGGVVRPLPCEVASYVFQNLDPNSSILYTHGSDSSIFNEVWFWYPSTGSSVPDKYVIYNYSEQWWSIGSMTRTAATGGSVYRYPIATDSSNYAYFQESGWTNNGAAITTQRYAETADINIQNGQNTMMIRQAMTDSGYGYSSTALTFYSSFTPEGSETTSGPYNPRSNGYTDIRVTGRDIRMKVVSTQDAEWSIGEVRLDLVPRGRR